MKAILAAMALLVSAFSRGANAAAGLVEAYLTRASRA
jgi:hypothetical protein